MTKYTLAGGKDRVGQSYGLKLAAELGKDHKTLRVLSCFFVVPKEHWGMMADKWKPWFEGLGKLDAYNYARPETFAEQIQDFDIIYIHGGSNKALFEAMNQYDNLGKMFTGKIVVASSAGANLLSKNYWGSLKKVAKKGKAIVDANIMTHCGATDREGTTYTPEDWQKEAALFRNFIGNDEKIWHIPEGDFITFEVDDE